MQRPSNSNANVVAALVLFAITAGHVSFAFAQSAQPDTAKAAAAPPQTAADAVLPIPGVTATLDRLLEEHWQRQAIKPAPFAPSTVLFRRAMLDLAGRIPTPAELEVFQKESATSPEAYGKLVQKLVDGPEFAWHFGTVLDEMIQSSHAGNTAFIGYLRKSLTAGKRWDTLFRELLVGPWDNDERKPAVGFLDRRAKDIDQLTADTARAFFGVDISCARCHDHPLVDDWKQDHYYGMAAFLIRTSGGKGSVSEKSDGEARFAPKGGAEKIARMMFLSGKTADDPPKADKNSPVKNEASKSDPKSGAKPAPYSRREVLVQMALEDKQFLSRAFVNRLWEYFFGRGLVDPVDQMHSGNSASIPAVLDALASDLINSGYDVRRLVTVLVLSKAYRLDAHWTDSAAIPGAESFAIARARPLSPRQLANSLLIALGDGRFEPTPERLTQLEKTAAEWIAKLDPRTRDFQSSTSEALFFSNGDAIKNLITPGGNNLTERLLAMTDDRQRLAAAFLATLARPPTATESERLLAYLGRAADKREGVADIVWSLVFTAEFRFNH